MIKGKCSATATALSALRSYAVIGNEHSDVIGSDRYGDFDV
jgi:hypothetical protein